MYVCLFVCLFLKRVNGSSYRVENACKATLIPSSPEMEPPLAAVGSATVAILSQPSGIAAIFAMRRGHVVYNNCAPYLSLYKQQCCGFYYRIAGIFRGITLSRISEKQDFAGKKSRFAVWVALY